ncbi:MAG: hypothetical protein WCJ81_06325 [bacterium]
MFVSDVLILTAASACWMMSIPNHTSHSAMTATLPDTLDGR